MLDIGITHPSSFYFSDSDLNQGVSEARARLRAGSFLTASMYTKLLAGDQSPAAENVLSRARASRNIWGEKGAFSCSRCGNTYARPHSLNRHLRFECGVEPQFECPICRKKSKHKHNLLLHMRTHQK